MNKITMPQRNQFNELARIAADEVFSYYEEKNVDFGSQGHFEKQYTESFAKLISPDTQGYADALCSGTAAIYTALLALNLEKGSEVLISPITDPGMVNPVILAGLTPKLIDHQKNAPYPSLKNITERVTPQVKAILLNHLGGIPIPEIKEICEWAKNNKIQVIEDCSQAHLASIEGQNVGTFGSIACFSTMFSKTHSTGGRGGVVYTQNLDLFNNIRMHSDKGKPFHLENFNEKDPRTFTMPALNLNIDEISCAIGSKTLKKLPEVIKKRMIFLKNLDEIMKNKNAKIKLHKIIDGASPFFWIFYFNSKNFTIDKTAFAEKLKELGVPLNSHYQYIVSEWPWITPYLADNFIPKNAIEFRNNTFNLLFNEKFDMLESNFIAEQIQIAENQYSIK